MGDIDQAEGPRMNVGPYDSDTGQDLEAEKTVDVSAHQNRREVVTMSFLRAKRGRIMQLNAGCAQIHYFIDELEGQRMMSEDSERFGFAPGHLTALALEHAP